MSNIADGSIVRYTKEAVLPSVWDIRLRGMVIRTGKIGSWNVASIKFEGDFLDEQLTYARHELLEEV